jgi:hypothetical protein
VVSLLFKDCIDDEEFPGTKNHYESMYGSVVDGLKGLGHKIINFQAWQGVESGLVRRTFIEYSFQFLVLAKEMHDSPSDDLIVKGMISEAIYSFSAIFSVKHFHMIDFGDFECNEFTEFKKSSSEYLDRVNCVDSYLSVIENSPDKLLRNNVGVLEMLIPALFGRSFYDSFL